MKEDKIYLEYILQCINKIEEYSQGKKKNLLIIHWYKMQL